MTSSGQGGADQESVYNSPGSSLLKTTSSVLKFQSHLPRPVGDKSPPAGSDTKIGGECLDSYVIHYFATITASMALEII